MKNAAPIMSAMIDINRMNLEMSAERGLAFVFVELDSSAMRPITVSSPILITTPFPEPSVQIVPKKAAFSLSRIF